MSKITELKQITTERTVGKKCDQCGREERDPKKYEDDWLYFSEGHNGWGNDSIESRHYYDVCSAKCFIAMLPERIKDNDGYLDAEIAEMPVNFCKQLLELVGSQRSKVGKP